MNYETTNLAKETLRNYPFSRDRSAFVALLQTQAVICLCDVQMQNKSTARQLGQAYRLTRETGQHRGESLYLISGSAGTIVWEDTLERFLASCDALHVEFLAPECFTELTADECPQPSALAQFFMWIGIFICALVAVTVLFILLNALTP